MNVNVSTGHQGAKVWMQDQKYGRRIKYVKQSRGDSEGIEGELKVSKMS